MYIGEYIKSIIKNVCSSFNITLDQIYTVTTDNGTNMLKAVRMLSSYEDCNVDILKQNETEDNADSNIDCDIYLEENEEENYEYKTENLNILENFEIEDVNFNFGSSILTGKKLLI